LHFFFLFPFGRTLIFDITDYSLQARAITGNSHVIWRPSYDGTAAAELAALERRVEEHAAVLPAAAVLDMRRRIALVSARHHRQRPSAPCRRPLRRGGVVVRLSAELHQHARSPHFERLDHLVRAPYVGRQVMGGGGNGVPGAACTRAAVLAPRWV
jgi:hypothetical protein